MAESDAQREFYDEVYYPAKGKRRSNSRHMRGLAQRIPIENGARVLDVGCGRGEWLQACQDQGAQIAGVDISEEAIAQCLQNLPDGEFHAQPATPLPFDDEKFDVVTCLGSLEHFPEPLLALQEMVRVGKADAKFVLLVPNADFLTRRLGLFGGTEQAACRELVLPLEEWETLFQSAGLEVQDRWRDLHVLSWAWITHSAFWKWPIRAAQAGVLACWPLRWQYQVFHLCEKYPQGENHE